MWKKVKGWLGWNNSGPPKQLFYEGRMVSRPGGLASTMNRFFIGKVRSLRENIPPVATDPLKQLKEAMKNRKCKFKMKLVSPDEVLKLIMDLKTSSATGVDHIDTLLSTNVRKVVKLDF